MLSRDTRRLNDRGSLRTETKSVPPRGIPAPAPGPGAPEAPFEPGDPVEDVPQPAPITVNTAISVARMVVLLECLVKYCPTGQQTGRLKSRRRQLLSYTLRAKCIGRCRTDANWPASWLSRSYPDKWI